MNFLAKYGLTLSLTAVLAVAAVGCSKGSGGSNPAGTGGGSLVCEGEAWIMVTSGVGYIFRPNNDIISVTDLGDGSWHGSNIGTYSIAGGKLTFVLHDETVTTMTYSFSGGKLTLSGSGDPVVFTKRTDVYVDL